MKIFGRTLRLPEFDFSIPWTVWPTLLAFASLLIGVGLAVYGVLLLAGLGWALIAAALPFLLLATILIRGLIRVG
jgi:hypothetical protein